MRSLAFPYTSHLSQELSVVLTSVPGWPDGEWVATLSISPLLTAAAKNNPKLIPANVPKNMYAVLSELLHVDAMRTTGCCVVSLRALGFVNCCRCDRSVVESEWYVIVFIHGAVY